MKKIGMVLLLIGLSYKMIAMHKSNINSSYMQKIDKLLTSYEQQVLFSGTVLVSHKGNIVLKKAYGLANRELNVANGLQMKFRIASLSKQFTALAILQLQEKKLLSLSDPLEKFVPNFTQGDIITLNHLLSHSSGIPNITFFADFGMKCLQPTTLTDEIEYIRSNSKQLDFVPGTKYTYSNSNYIILSYIIEKVSGQSFESYLQDKILKPLGMNNSGLENTSKILPNRTSGYIRNDIELKNAPYLDFSWAVGSGGMYSTIEDMYRWDRALFANQQSIAMPESFKQIVTPHIAISTQAPNLSYGFGLVLTECDFGLCVSHEGNIQGFSSYMTHYSSDDTSIIILSNFAFSPYKTIEVAIRNILSNKPYELPQRKTSLTLKKENLEKFVGTYQMEEVQGVYRRAPTKFEIHFADGHLVLTMRNNNYKIYPQSPNVFFFTSLDATLTFELDQENNVTGVVYQQNQEITPGKKI